MRLGLAHIAFLTNLSLAIKGVFQIFAKHTNLFVNILFKIAIGFTEMKCYNYPKYFVLNLWAHTTSMCRILLS